ncbi:DUF1328 domain-containing protein [Aporhodopirellula aestuarii]
MSWHSNRIVRDLPREKWRSRLRETPFSTLEIAMLGWALTFLIIALIAGVLGFGVVAGTAATIAKVLFVVFLVLFVIGLLMGRRGPVA